MYKTALVFAFLVSALHAQEKTLLCGSARAYPSVPAPSSFLDQAVVRRIEPSDNTTIVAHYGCVEARVQVVVDRVGKVVESCAVHQYGDRRDELVLAAVHAAGDWVFKPNFGLPGAGGAADYRHDVITFIYRAKIDDSRIPRLASIEDDGLIAQLVNSSNDPLDAASLATEVVRRGEPMIPLLIKLRGNREPFAGGWALGRSPICESSDNSRQIPIEVAALFLIQGAYYGRLQYANAAILTDTSAALYGNSPESIRRAWESVESWERERLAHGMLWLREKHRPPLPQTGVHFF